MSGNPWAFDNFLPGGDMYVPSTETIISEMGNRFLQEMEQQKFQHAIWMQEKEEQNQQQMIVIKNECFMEIRGLKDQHMNEYLSLQRVHQQEIEEVKKNHLCEVNSMQASYEQQTIIINENNRKLSEESNRIEELSTQLDEMLQKINELQQQRVEYQQYKKDTIEQSRILSEKYTESIEKHLEYQEEVARLTLINDTRGREIRHLQDELLLLQNDVQRSTECMTIKSSVSSVPIELDDESGSQYNSVVSDQNWDAQLMSGNISNPCLQLAKELVEAERQANVVQVNSGHMSHSNNHAGYSKHKYPLKQF